MAKTGINENLAQAVKVMPGAEPGQYFVDLGNSVCQNITIMVNDISGRTLQKGILYYSGSGFVGPVDISNYSAGMYLLSLNCLNKTYYAKLIVR